MKGTKRSPLNGRVSVLNGVAREKWCFAFETRSNRKKRKENISRNRNKEILPGYTGSSFYPTTSRETVLGQWGT